MRAMLMVVLVLGTLGAAFFRTQILQNSDFVLRADDNRFRVVPIPSPRGTVRDRNGKIVAETVAGYTLSVEPGPVDSVRFRLTPLIALLGLDTASVAEILERAEHTKAEPVLVSDELSFNQVSKLEEQRGQLRGVILEARPVRRYPEGEAVAHIAGYIGEISDKELQSDQWTGYRSGQQIGKTGIERQYERTLGGVAGSRYVEVNATGRILGRFATQVASPPVPGEDLKLTLDLDLQRFVHALFPADKRGAVVAMIPTTGEVLALYSRPTYDPNRLIGHIPPTLWRELNSDPGRPLLNRATNGIYPPGSTWKLATAMVGLEKGVITPKERMPLACSGGMLYAGRYSRCWKREGHGPQDLISAIANSCNVYFYQLGIRLGLDMLTREGTRLGFSRRTEIDLPGEKVGTFPTGRAWYVRRFGWKPPPSEVMNLSIGQGPNSQTPVRMAQFFSAVAGNGTAQRPHLVARKNIPIETDLGVSSETLDAVRLGMARVVEVGGTAHAVELRRWKLYGKTGTSQNAQDLKKPHAWFTGFAGRRGKPPEVVVAVIVEFGESGSGAAAPIASRVADFYLSKKYGLPPPSAELPKQKGN